MNFPHSSSGVRGDPIDSFACLAVAADQSYVRQAARSGQNMRQFRGVAGNRDDGVRELRTSALRVTPFDLYNLLDLKDWIEVH